jgi:hypothetical protein
LDVVDVGVEGSASVGEVFGPPQPPVWLEPWTSWKPIELPTMVIHEAPNNGRGANVSTSQNRFLEVGPSQHFKPYLAVRSRAAFQFRRVLLRVDTHSLEQLCGLPGRSLLKGADMVRDRERMLATVHAIQQFHQVGLESLRRRPGKAGYASGELETEAVNIRMNADTLRKARAFAHPVTGYSTSELKKFCQAIRLNWTNFISRNSAVGPTHVILLMGVPKYRGERARMQAKMLKDGWSTSELQSEIHKAFGRRRQGGRKADLGASVEDVLVRLDQHRETWLRMHAELVQRDERGHPAGVKALPPAIRSTLARITVEMHKISDVIARQLKHSHRAHG